MSFSIKSHRDARQEDRVREIFAGDSEERQELHQEVPGHGDARTSKLASRRRGERFLTAKWRKILIKNINSVLNYYFKSYCWGF